MSCPRFIVDKTSQLEVANKSEASYSKVKNLELSHAFECSIIIRLANIFAAIGILSVNIIQIVIAYMLILSYRYWKSGSVTILCPSINLKRIASSDSKDRLMLPPTSVCNPSWCPNWTVRYRSELNVHISCLLILLHFQLVLSNVSMPAYIICIDGPVRSCHTRHCHFSLSFFISHKNVAFLVHLLPFVPTTTRPPPRNDAEPCLPPTFFNPESAKSAMSASAGDTSTGGHPSDCAGDVETGHTDASTVSEALKPPLPSPQLLLKMENTTC